MGAQVLNFLVLMQLGTLLINLFISAIHYGAHRTHLFRLMLILWAFKVLQFICFALAQNVFYSLLLEPIVCLGVVQILINDTMLKMLYSVHNDASYSSRKYLLYAFPALTVGTLYSLTEGANFGLAAALCVWPPIIPALYVGFRFLFKKGNPRLIRTLVAVYLLGLIHLLDFPLLRQIEWFAPYGFTLHNSLLIAFSILLPSVIIQVLNSEHSAEILQREKKYRTLYESSRDAIVLYDPAEGRFLSGNPAALELFGMANESQLLQSDPVEISPELQEDGQRSAEKSKQMIEIALAEGSHAFHWIHRKRGGESFYATVLLSATRIREAVLLQATIRDVTAERKAQDDLDQYRSHLEELVEQKTAELKSEHEKRVVLSRQVGMSEVATGVLHNVGNAVNSINVSVNLLREHLGRLSANKLAALAGLLQEATDDRGDLQLSQQQKAKVPKYVNKLAQSHQREVAKVESEIERLGANLQQIKGIVADQQGLAGRTSWFEEVQVSEALRQVQEITEAGLRANGVGLKVECDDDLAVVSDQLKIVHIVVNLVENANNATAEIAGDLGPPVEIHAGENGRDEIAIRVVDRGQGVRAKDVEKLFSQGFTTKQGGRGFGLHSSALAAKDLNGHLSYSDNKDQPGSTFVLTLPSKPDTGQS